MRNMRNVVCRNTTSMYQKDRITIRDTEQPVEFLNGPPHQTRYPECLWKKTSIITTTKHSGYHRNSLI